MCGSLGNPHELLEARNPRLNCTRTLTPKQPSKQNQLMNEYPIMGTIREILLTLNIRVDKISYRENRQPETCFVPPNRYSFRCLYCSVLPTHFFHQL
jgi:hypothetical protein